MGVSGSDTVVDNSLEMTHEATVLIVSGACLVLVLIVLLGASCSICRRWPSTKSPRDTVELSNLVILAEAELGKTAVAPTQCPSGTSKHNTGTVSPTVDLKPRIRSPNMISNIHHPKLSLAAASTQRSPPAVCGEAGLTENLDTETYHLARSGSVVQISPEDSMDGRSSHDDLYSTKITQVNDHGSSDDLYCNLSEVGISSSGKTCEELRKFGTQESFYSNTSDLNLPDVGKFVAMCPTKQRKLSKSNNDIINICNKNLTTNMLGSSRTVHKNSPTSAKNDDTELYINTELMPQLKTRTQDERPKCQNAKKKSTDIARGVPPSQIGQTRVRPQGPRNIFSDPGPVDSGLAYALANDCETGYISSEQHSLITPPRRHLATNSPKRHIPVNPEFYEEISPTIKSNPTHSQPVLESDYDCEYSTVEVASGHSNAMSSYDSAGTYTRLGAHHSKAPAHLYDHFG